MQHNYSLAFVAGLKRATDEGSLPEIAQYSPYCLPLNVFTASKGSNLLPPKPKSSFRHLKQGIQEFHRKYVLVPADKAANNVVVVCRLHYVNTLKQELDGTMAYLETDTDEVSVVNAHLNDLPVKFSVCVNEGQDKLLFYSVYNITT